MVKKFTIPFASQGDANDIPDALQVDGKVSFTQGFGYDYERPYDDPQAKDIAREDMNGLFKAITSAVGELQTLGASEWSNDIAYPKGAIVYFEKDLYISQVDDNQNKPPQSWASIKSIADDSLKKAMNLADLTDVAEARKNLKLGNSATLNKTDILGTSSELVATQKLVNDTKINLDNSVRAVDIKADKAQESANTAIAKADNAQSKADSAYNLAESKQDMLTFVGAGRDVMKVGAFGLGGRDSILAPLEYNNLFYKYHDTPDKTVEGTFGVQMSTTADSFGQVGFRDYNLGELRYRHKVGNQFIAGRVLTEQFNQQIGIGQSWVDVTNQRQIKVTYVNNTNKPILVCVNGDESAISASVNGVSVSIGGSYSNVVSFIVPPGSSYYVDRDTTKGKLATWSELR